MRKCFVTEGCGLVSDLVSGGWVGENLWKRVTETGHVISREDAKARKASKEDRPARSCWLGLRDRE